MEIKGFFFKEDKMKYITNRNCPSQHKVYQGKTTQYKI